MGELRRAVIRPGVDTSDATATADKILSGYTAYAKGKKVTGTRVVYSPNADYASVYANNRQYTFKELHDMSDGLISAPTHMITFYPAGDTGVSRYYDNNTTFLNSGRYQFFFVRV